MPTWFVKQGKYTKKYHVDYEREGGLIVFTKSPFHVKDEIKCMRGARWDMEEKKWTADDHARNWFQIRALEGHNVYEHFEQPIAQHDGIRPEMSGDYQFQADAVNTLLTRRYQILWADTGTGKTIIASETRRMLGNPRALWVGPLSSRDAIFKDWEKWGYEPMEFCHFDMMHKWSGETPQVLIVDESHKLKHDSSLRSQALQRIADNVRSTYGWDGIVVLLSGTPATKAPDNWYAQAEIAWPGFLREGSTDAFRKRYGVFEPVPAEVAGVPTEQLVGWKEDEVEQLQHRLSGLVTRVRKQDVLNLPPIKYIKVNLEMSGELKAVARAIANTTASGGSLAQKLRQLSDGFQYLEDDTAYEIPTPKEDALKLWTLGQHRVIVSACYQASIDRCVRVLQEAGFSVIQCDGRKFAALDAPFVKPLDHWASHPGPVAWVANPQSGGTSFTLVEASRIVIWSNDFFPDARIQMIDRLHRIGQTKEVEVVDLLHGPGDAKILDTLRENRRIELLSHSELLEGF